MRVFTVHYTTIMIVGVGIVLAFVMAAVYRTSLR